MKDLYDLGETPPAGHIPKSMYAVVIRPDRFGPPAQAMQLEVVDVPLVGPGQVLLWVLTAGVNYNNVWAGLGSPVNVIALRKRRGSTVPFHIGGSDGAGIVWAVGEGVRQAKVGDEVIVTGAQWDERAVDIRMGVDPTVSRSVKAWGYETNFGCFAQFALADEYQVHPKPPGLAWEDAGCFGATAGTAYRQLCGWPPHVVGPGDPVLIWGGAGGLGSMAIQIVRQRGGIPVAVVSDAERAAHCRSLGAAGVIDRREFDHWGRLPDTTDTSALRRWQLGVRGFQHRFWQIIGSQRDPRIVFEHSGQDTFPTSVSVCDPGGMVVLCGGTSGYNGDADLRVLWMHQKRVQGSHAANTQQFRAVIDLVAAGLLDPCRTRTVPLAETGAAHESLYANSGNLGNIAIRVNASSDSRSERRLGTQPESAVVSGSMPRVAVSQCP
ncbi:crotonyl-CoA carboxylase/reductase [Streptomyces pathocidini]|uniref:crotonyl-CoA carboxylase/reductase n=1 Tax=Streptomyces pathocidini TaxID=1650571 RepID=UPI0033DB9F35